MSKPTRVNDKFTIPKDFTTHATLVGSKYQIIVYVRGKENGTVDLSIAKINDNPQMPLVQTSNRTGYSLVDNDFEYGASVITLTQKDADDIYSVNIWQIVAGTRGTIAFKLNDNVDRFWGDFARRHNMSTDADPRAVGNRKSDEDDFEDDTPEQDMFGLPVEPKEVKKKQKVQQLVDPTVLTGGVPIRQYSTKSIDVDQIYAPRPTRKTIIDMYSKPLMMVAFGIVAVSVLLKIYTNEDKDIEEYYKLKRHENRMKKARAIANIKTQQAHKSKVVADNTIARAQQQNQKLDQIDELVKRRKQNVLSGKVPKTSAEKLKDMNEKEQLDKIIMSEQEVPLTKQKTANIGKNVSAKQQQQRIKAGVSGQAGGFKLGKIKIGEGIVKASTQLLGTGMKVGGDIVKTGFQEVGNLTGAVIKPTAGAVGDIIKTGGTAVATLPRDVMQTTEGVGKAGLDFLSAERSRGVERKGIQRRFDAEKAKLASGEKVQSIKSQGEISREKVRQGIVDQPAIQSSVPIPVQPQVSVRPQISVPKGRQDPVVEVVKPPVVEVVKPPVVDPQDKPNLPVDDPNLQIQKGSLLGQEEDNPIIPKSIFGLERFEQIQKDNPNMTEEDVNTQVRAEIVLSKENTSTPGKFEKSLIDNRSEDIGKFGSSRNQVLDTKTGDLDKASQQILKIIERTKSPGELREWRAMLNRQLNIDKENMKKKKSKSEEEIEGEEEDEPKINKRMKDIFSGNAEPVTDDEKLFSNKLPFINKIGNTKESMKIALDNPDINKALINKSFKSTPATREIIDILNLVGKPERSKMFAGMVKAKANQLSRRSKSKKVKSKIKAGIKTAVGKLKRKKITKEEKRPLLGSDIGPPLPDIKLQKKKVKTKLKPPIFGKRKFSKESAFEEELKADAISKKAQQKTESRSATGIEKNIAELHEEIVEISEEIADIVKDNILLDKKMKAFLRHGVGNKKQSEYQEMKKQLEFNDHKISNRERELAIVGKKHEEWLRKRI